MGKGRWVMGDFAHVSEDKAIKLSANTARPMDLIFTQRGTLGQVALVPPDQYKRYIISQSQMKLTVDSAKADPLYLYYVFSAPSMIEYIRNHAIQTGVPHTNLGILRNTPLQLPSVPEQRRIALILGGLDDKIELNRSMNQTLEEIARTIFKSWFIDFDPVRAKAEGRQPAGMDAEAAALFPDSLGDSELGPVPAGWQIRNIGSFASLDKGVSYKGAHLADTGIPMINLGCFAGAGRFKRENLKFYTGQYKPRHLVSFGDVVMANTDITQKREVLGSPALVPPNDENGPWLFTHHVFALRMTQNKPDLRTYMYFLLLQEEFRARAIGFATGTTVLALPRESVLGMSVVLPPDTLCKKFAELAGTILSRSWSNDAQNTVLSNIRDALLPKLLSGELRVSGAERELAGASL